MFSNVKTQTEVRAENLAIAKDNGLAQINTERDEAIAAGVTFGGKIYQSDNQSIADLHAITTLSTLDSSITVPWLTQDNTVVSLNATEIQSLAGAFSQHKTTLIIAARTKKDAVLAATTLAQVVTALT